MNSRSALLFRINIFLLIALGIISCTEKDKPKNLLPEQTFIDLIGEFQVLQAVFNLQNDTTVLLSMKDSVLKRYKITLDDFYQSEEYYARDSKKYQELMKKSLDKLLEIQTEKVEKRPAKTKR